MALADSQPPQPHQSQFEQSTAQMLQGAAGPKAWQSRISSGALGGVCQDAGATPPAVCVETVATRSAVETGARHESEPVAAGSPV